MLDRHVYAAACIVPPVYLPSHSVLPSPLREAVMARAQGCVSNKASGVPHISTSCMSRLQQLPAAAEAHKQGLLDGI